MAKRNTRRAPVRKKGNGRNPVNAEYADKQIKAFMLYIQGGNQNEIAKQLNLHSKTISDWIKTNGWVKARSEYSAKLKSEIEAIVLDDDITAIKSIKDTARTLLNEAISLPMIPSGKVEQIAEARQWATLALKVDGKIDDSPKVSMTITEIMKRGSLKKEAK